jgi:hypothetical protein
VTALQHAVDKKPSREEASECLLCAPFFPFAAKASNGDSSPEADIRKVADRSGKE